MDEHDDLPTDAFEDFRDDDLVEEYDQYNDDSDGEPWGDEDDADEDPGDLDEEMDFPEPY